MPTHTRSNRPATVTMHDVAKRARVSQSTVSRILSQSASPIPIGEETRQRVLEAVKELGYHPNLHAGSLRGQKTQMIAMMIADIANPFYHPMVRAVQDVAHAHRYDVLVANSDHLRENELLFCESMIRRPVDGIILVPYNLTNQDIDTLVARTGAAVSALGQHIDHPAVDTVYVDDGPGIYQATQWLIQQRGHRQLGFIGVTRNFSVGARRQDAFLCAIKQAGLEIAPEYLVEGDWSVESGGQQMRQLMSLPKPPTAVFACNDNMAIGAILAAQEMGLCVPKDVSVVGFDDIPAASWIRPKLTTLSQFPAEIGDKLATALFERINDPALEGNRRFEVHCQFIERESA